MQAFEAVLALTLGIAACDEFGKEKPPPPQRQESPAALASALGVDASDLAVPTDPAPPAGDLKAELDRFVSVESCVAERSKLDPLVGDALSAIGYDTFLHDACRLLQATKDKKRESCDRVDAAPLRAKCLSWVAIVSEMPDACPFDTVPARGRNATCLAVAGKDPRLCKSETKAASRATCEALTTQDEKSCASLAAAERAGCSRELARFRNLLARPLEGLSKLAEPRGKLVVKGESPTPDPETSEVNLGLDVGRGVVVVTSRDRARVELGLLGDSDAVRIAAAPTKRSRVGVAVVFQPDPRGGPEKPTLDRLELEVPGQPTFVKCDCAITSASVDRKRGSPFAIALKGTVRSGPAAYRIDVDVTTFVRDVVADSVTRR